MVVHRPIRIVAVAMVTSALLVAAQGVAAAGPKGPPSYGSENPAGLEHCPPAPVAPDVGIEKCFLAGWAQGDEVHIVTDPLAGSGSAVGTVTFWCQSIVGFKYQIRVAGLMPNASYTVTATSVFGTGSLAESLGTFRTDANGYGSLNGVLKLAPGGYLVVLEVRHNGTHLALDSWGDLQGFGVYAH